MNALQNAAISPLAVAAKLADAAQRTQPAFAKQLKEQPRLAELLWYLQSVSMQPGGMEDFASDIIQQFSAQFGPADVHDENAPLTLEQRERIWKTLSDRVEKEIIAVQSWANPRDNDEQRDWAYENFGRYPKPRDPEELKRFRAALLKIPLHQFRDVFLDAAKDGLASHLRALCLGESKDDEWSRQDIGGHINLSPWYCENLAAVLFEAMELHAGRIALQLARTQIVELVFDALDYAWQQKVLVKIEGDTRTGKSEAVKAWCSMHPGKARLVSTPSGKSLSDLFKAIAEAVGLPYGPRTKGTDLKEQIQYIMRHSGLFLVLDESHFILPVNFDRNTQPGRLDWLRTQIIDRKLPVALVTTPQAFAHAVNKFERHTSYNFGQFFGRIMADISLPNELSEADLLAVAKIQGADIPEKLHPFIVAKSMQSEGYLKAIEAICSRSRYLAARENHRAVTLADVESAAAYVIPTKPAPARPDATAPASRRKQPVAVKRGRPATPQPPAAPALEMPPREVAPTLETVNH
jgi:hypothetical protein